jgi:hypothetical protein
VRTGLDAIRISTDCRRVTVAGHQLPAANPHQLRDVVTHALYHSWHTGLPPDAHPRPGEPDPEFVEALAGVVPQRTTVAPATVVEPGRGGAAAVVRLHGVLVRMPVGAAVGPARVEVDAVRRALLPGYLVVDGSRGRCHATGPIMRLYLHVASPDGAPAVLGEVVSALEARGLAYRVKICADRTSFPRRDALVAYLGGADWPVADDLAAGLRGLAGIGREVSLFARRLAPGVAAAWEPADDRPGLPDLSFGQHRSFAVATGIVAYARTPGRGSRQAAVVDALVQARIDPTAPFRNLPAPIG